MLFILIMKRVCSTDKFSYQLYFFRITNAWSMLHHRSVKGFQSNEWFFMLHTPFWHLSLFFHQKCGFIIFISLFHEVSNFCNRISTNQKPKLEEINCRWNSMKKHILPRFQNNSEHEKQIILLMTPNNEGWYYITNYLHS